MVVHGGRLPGWKELGVPYHHVLIAILYQQHKCFNQLYPCWTKPPEG